jgi:TetR/AcrR family transcriptional regulator, cholesterol catabolism regulator
MVTATSRTGDDHRDNPPGGVRTAASQRIMRAGVNLFAEVGFLATTIRDLTKACGVTAPSFYNHFESKEGLLHAIIDETNAKLERDVAAVDVSGQQPQQVLEDLVRTLVTFNLNNPKEARVANHEYVFLQPSLRSEVVAHRRQVLGAFEAVLALSEHSRGLLDSGQHSGELEIRLLAISIVNLTISSTDWYRRDGTLTIQEVAQAYCRLALRMAGFTGPHGRR